MTDHKYTDEEVIKALECCVGGGDCENCPRWSEQWTTGTCADFLPSVLDLIKRQQSTLNEAASFIEKICQIANRCCLISCDGKPVPRKGTSRHDVYRAFYELQQMLAPIFEEAINMRVERARSVFMEAISNDPPSVQSRLSSEIE